MDDGRCAPRPRGRAQGLRDHRDSAVCRSRMARGRATGRVAAHRERRGDRPGIARRVSAVPGCVTVRPPGIHGGAATPARDGPGVGHRRLGGVRPHGREHRVRLVLLQPDRRRSSDRSRGPPSRSACHPHRGHGPRRDRDLASEASGGPRRIGLRRAACPAGHEPGALIAVPALGASSRAAADRVAPVDPGRCHRADGRAVPMALRRVVAPRSTTRGRARRSQWAPGGRARRCRPRGHVGDRPPPT